MELSQSSRRLGGSVWNRAGLIFVGYYFVYMGCLELECFSMSLDLTLCKIYILKIGQDCKSAKIYWKKLFSSENLFFSSSLFLDLFDHASAKISKKYFFVAWLITDGHVDPCGKSAYFQHLISERCCMKGRHLGFTTSRIYCTRFYSKTSSLLHGCL